MHLGEIILPSLSDELRPQYIPPYTGAEPMRHVCPCGAHSASLPNTRRITRDRTHALVVGVLVQSLTAGVTARLEGLCPCLVADSTAEDGPGFHGGADEAGLRGPSF